MIYNNTLLTLSKIPKLRIDILSILRYSSSEYLLTYYFIVHSSYGIDLLYSSAATMKEDEVHSSMLDQKDGLYSTLSG
jgi:hypothetical protein